MNEYPADTPAWAPNWWLFPYGVRPDSPAWESHDDPCVERVRVMVAWHNLGLRDD